MRKNETMAHFPKTALVLVAVLAAFPLVRVPAVAKPPAAAAGEARYSLPKGLSYLEQGLFAEARVVFSHLAAEGDAKAMYHLGAMSHSGLGGEENLEHAIAWYREAAQRKVPEAQLALGSLLYKGKGTAKDLNQALKLFKAAAEAGLLAAQYNLAMMHTAGLAHSKEYGAQEDKPRAYKWFAIVLAQLADDAEATANVKEGLTFLKKDMNASEIELGRAMAENWMKANAHVMKTPAKGDGK